MFIVQLPIDEYKPKRQKSNPLTEEQYYTNDIDLLSQFRCPTCKSYALFRGCVYIGCNGCLNYFSEKEIIEENISEG